MYSVTWADVSIERRGTNRIPWGEASTNIMSALAIKLCAQITIQLSDHQNLQIFTKFYSFPFSVGRTAEL